MTLAEQLGKDVDKMNGKQRGNCLVASCLGTIGIGGSVTTLGYLGLKYLAYGPDGRFGPGMVGKETSYTFYELLLTDDTYKLYAGMAIVGTLVLMSWLLKSYPNEN